MTQAEMAALTGVRQPTVSRWEAGLLQPSLRVLRRIRDEAACRGLAWDDAWLFDGAPPKRKRAA